MYNMFFFSEAALLGALIGAIALVIIVVVVFAVICKHRLNLAASRVIITKHN